MSRRYTTRPVLPGWVAAGSPDHVVGYMQAFLQHVHWLTNATPALLAGDDAAPRQLTDGLTLEYKFTVEFRLDDARKVVVDVHLDSTAEARRFRLNLVSAYGIREWSWHFDNYHPELGAWGHEHRGDAAPVLSSAQDTEAALVRLRDEL